MRWFLGPDWIGLDFSSEGLGAPEGRQFTITLTVAVWVRLPEVPVIVIV
jgi:hypothetical protein